MNSSQLKKHASIRKKIGCALPDCGQHVTFTIAEHVAKLAEDRKKIYTGVCTKCHQTFRLNASQVLTFQAIYGKAKFETLKSSYSQLFDEGDNT